MVIDYINQDFKLILINIKNYILVCHNKNITNDTFNDNLQAEKTHFMDTHQINEIVLSS